MKINFNSSNTPITRTLPSGAIQYMPEPTSKVSSMFKTLLNTGIEFGKNLFTSSPIGGAVSSATSSLIGIQPEYADLIRQQLQVQEQMQKVSLVSNIEKSRHETDMAVVRNIRVG